MNDDLGGDPACWAHLFDSYGDHASEQDPTSPQPTGSPDMTDSTSTNSTNSTGLTDDASLAKLLHGLADAVIIADPTGTIVYWNAAAERLFGWPANRAIGSNLDLIIPERQRSAHWTGYEQVMDSGHTRYGSELLRVPALHADGQRRSIAFTVSLLTGPGGATTGIAAVVRDETQRWADEQDLRRQLREAQAAATGPGVA